MGECNCSTTNASNTSFKGTWTWGTPHTQTHTCVKPLILHAHKRVRIRSRHMVFEWLGTLASIIDASNTKSKGHVA